MIEATPEFLKEETRWDHTISADMKQIWAVQMRMVQKIMEVCNRHRLTVYADGGTVLGAVRHEGYIPWDDDIDLIMLRPDYDKLLSIAPDEFEAPYHFQTALTDKDYQRGHAQLRYDGTSAILHSEYDKDRTVAYHLGVFVDIFVLDGVEDDDRLFEKRKQKYERLRGYMRAIADVEERRHPSLKSRIVGNVLKACGQTVEGLFKKSEEVLKSVPCEGSRLVAPLGLIFSKGRTCRPRSIYDGIVMHKFEYLSLPLPSGYLEFLEICYGKNYMTPIKNSSMHGEFAVLSASRDYRQVMSERQ